MISVGIAPLLNFVAFFLFSPDVPCEKKKLTLGLYSFLLLLLVIVAKGKLLDSRVFLSVPCAGAAPRTVDRQKRQKAFFGGRVDEI